MSNSPNQLGNETSVAPETTLDGGKAAPPARLGSLDICRGIAILAVLFIHVSGHFLPALHPAKSHTPPNWAWYALAVPNLDAQWAVPCFLMLSAFVNALSLGRTPDVFRYARRRLQTAVLPYVLWSGVYVAVNHALGHGQHLSLGHIDKLLLTGTAEFHLYFFVLVIELYILLPLLVPLFQRRPPFWIVALGAVVLQAAVYALNRFVLLHQFQTTILWDILPVALGLWLVQSGGPLAGTLSARSVGGGPDDFGGIGRLYASRRRDSAASCTDQHGGLPGFAVGIHRRHEFSHFGAGRRIRPKPLDGPAVLSGRRIACDLCHAPAGDYWIGQAGSKQKCRRGFGNGDLLCRVPGPAAGGGRVMEA